MPAALPAVTHACRRHALRAWRCAASTSAGDLAEIEQRRRDRSSSSSAASTAAVHRRHGLRRPARPMHRGGAGPFASDARPRRVRAASTGSPGSIRSSRSPTKVACPRRPRDAVVDPVLLAKLFEQAGIAEQLQVPRDPRLALAEHLASVRSPRTRPARSDREHRSREGSAAARSSANSIESRHYMNIRISLFFDQSGARWQLNSERAHGYATPAATGDTSSY